MLRTVVFRLCRTINVHNYRTISTSLYHGNKLQRPNIDELFSKNPIEPFVEDPIIAKKFFIGEVDREQMFYPEILEKHEIDAIIELNQNVSEYIKTSIEFDSKGISKSIYEAFKQMKLYGYNVPIEFGGHGYNHTQTILASEAEAINVCVAMTLNAHRLVCKAINEFGNDEQRANYLPNLVNGEKIATIAFQEWTRTDIAATQSIAEYDVDKKQWRLNGIKSFVINAAKSNLFMVSAHVPQSEKSDSLSCFLVDANLSGVSVHKKDITIGHIDLYQADVSFNDVYLESDAILSTPGSGRHIERTIMFLSRLQQSTLNMVQMRKITDYMLNMINDVEQKNRINNPDGTSFEASTLRLELSKGISNIYAVESMLYMTAGLMDLYKNTNIDVETAILKTFSQDKLLSMAINLSNFVDASVTLNEHPMNRIIRDALQLQTLGEPKDILKLYIGVAGIQHSGDRGFDDIRQKRNPLFYPEQAMRNFFNEESMLKYKSTLKLTENVVCEFDNLAYWLEASIQRLRIGANILMTAHGRNIFAEHQEIQRLAETVAYIYASFACLVRANRSWILKLTGAEEERILAGCCIDMYTKLIKEQMEHIEEGPMYPIDKHYRVIAKQVMKTKSYFPVHPLSRFF